MHVQMTGIVTERENKLTQAMTGMGMLQSAHWLSWATWELSMVIIISLTTVAAGAAFQIDFFLDNAFGNTFFVLFMFQLAMTGLAFLMAAFLRKSTVAVIVGYGVFLLGWIMQVCFCSSLLTNACNAEVNLLIGTYQTRTQACVPIEIACRSVLLKISHQLLMLFC